MPPPHGVNTSRRRQRFVRDSEQQSSSGARDSISNRDQKNSQALFEFAEEFIQSGRRTYEEIANHTAM